jgi:hypothetical protein
MCGILGQVKMGALFMDRRNAENCLAAVRAVINLGDVSATLVYWNFVWSRARRVSFAGACSEENLATARLACLCRVKGPAELTALNDAIRMLTRQQRNSLVNALVADGSAEKAFVFIFLPAFLDSARKNPMIGLRSALSFLADLVQWLKGHSWVHDADAAVVEVDLSELATFTAQVRTQHDFEVCMAHVRLVEHTQGCLRLSMTSKNWHRIMSSTPQEENLGDIRQLLHQVRNQQESYREEWKAQLAMLGPSARGDWQPNGPEHSHLPSSKSERPGSSSFIKMCLL